MLFELKIRIRVFGQWYANPSKTLQLSRRSRNAGRYVARIQLHDFFGCPITPVTQFHTDPDRAPDRYLIRTRARVSVAESGQPVSRLSQ